MATSTILRNISIKNKAQCSKLIRALEDSSAQNREPVQMQKTVHVMTKEQIRKNFGEKECLSSPDIGK